MEKLVHLQAHPNEAIYSKALALLETYFTDEGDGDLADALGLNTSVASDAGVVVLNLNPSLGNRKTDDAKLNHLTVHV